MIDPALRRFYSLGIDRGQRKRGPALLGGLAMFVLASAACALATTIGMLIAARGVQALAIAAIAVVPRAVVRDQFAGDRAAHVLSLMGMVLGIAPVVAPILGGHVYLRLGWQANFVLVALYGLVLLGRVYAALPETLRWGIDAMIRRASIHFRRSRAPRRRCCRSCSSCWRRRPRSRSAWRSTERPARWRR